MPEEMVQQNQEAGAGLGVPEVPVAPATAAAPEDGATLELKRRISGLDRDNAKLRQELAQREAERAGLSDLHAKIEGLGSTVSELAKHVLSGDPEAATAFQGKVVETQQRQRQTEAQRAYQQRLDSIGAEVLETLTEAGLDPESKEVQALVMEGNSEAANPDSLKRMEGLRKSARRVAFGKLKGAGMDTKATTPPPTIAEQVRQGVAEELKKRGLYDAETSKGVGTSGKVTLQDLANFTPAGKTARELVKERDRLLVGMGVRRK